MAFPARPNRLRGILNDSDLSGVCDLQNSVHLRHQPKKVNRHDGSCITSHCCRDLSRCKVVVDGVDVDEYGSCTQAGDRSNGCTKGERRGDDLVARSNSQRHQCQNQCVRAGRTADCKTAAHKRGNFGLEIVNLWSEDEVLALEDPANRRQNFIFYAAVLCL